MKEDEKSDEFIQKIGSVFSEINKLNEKELQLLSLLVDDVINQQLQDIAQIESLLDRLFELVLFETGQDVYSKLLDYLATFNPSLAHRIQEHDDELLGKYDYIIEEAKLLSQDIHAGQTDKAGIDYFSGHLTAVGEAGHTWKDKVVGYLHDAAEDTDYTVVQIVNMLQTRCSNKILQEHLVEIEEALNLLDYSMALNREEYIVRIKNSVIATRVKLNDLRHNMDISRIPKPTDKDFERLKRYKKEYRTILEYLGPVYWEWDDSD